MIEMLIGPQLAGDGVASIGVASEKAKLRCLLPNPGPNLLGEWPSPMSAGMDIRVAMLPSGYAFTQLVATREERAGRAGGST